MTAAIGVMEHIKVNFAPHVSLNTSNALVQTVDIHRVSEDVALFLSLEPADKETFLAKGKEVWEAQFLPLLIGGIDQVVVLLTSPDCPPTAYAPATRDGCHYLLIDDDYESFFREQRFKAATEALQECGAYPHIAKMRKVYLPNHILYKEHAPQPYLRKGIINPHAEQCRSKGVKEIYTISAGAAGSPREEIIKFAWNGDTLEYGPMNPSLTEFLKDPCDTAGPLTDFLGRAHFFKTL